jgi:NADH-quinone oxidoreductase subunit J
MELIAFFVLAVLAVASALVVISHRNPVISALALGLNLISIAGFYLVLRAQFIALLQVIVYAGAILVLIVFVIMLLNLRDEARQRESGSIQRVVGPLLALAFAVLLGRALLSGAASPFPARPAGFGTVEAVGRELFTRFFYPFEVISLLLIVAMVGAVLLAKRRL